MACKAGRKQKIACGVCSLLLVLTGATGAVFFATGGFGGGSSPNHGHKGFCSLHKMWEVDNTSQCRQSDCDCKFVVFAKAAESGLTDGNCSSLGYTVKGAVMDKKYPVIGDVKITTFYKPTIITAEASCSLYEIQGADCGQSDLDCQYVKYAKLAEKSLQDGTCASQGYTVKGKVETKTYPVVGNITISHYSKPAIALRASCSLYEIQGADCGQSDLDCQYVKYAKLAEKALQDGTCASQGYTVKGKVETKTYPVVGNITISHYSKPALEAATILL